MPPAVRRELELHAQATFEDTILRARELMLLEDRKKVRAQTVEAVKDVTHSDYTTELERPVQHLEAQLRQPTPTWSKEKYPQLPHTPRGLNKRDLICFQCNQPGHLRRNCPLFSGPKQMGLAIFVAKWVITNVIVDKGPLNLKVVKETISLCTVQSMVVLMQDKNVIVIEHPSSRASQLIASIKASQRIASIKSTG